MTALKGSGSPPPPPPRQRTLNPKHGTKKHHQGCDGQQVANPPASPPSAGLAERPARWVPDLETEALVHCRPPPGPPHLGTDLRSREESASPSHAQELAGRRRLAPGFRLVPAISAAGASCVPRPHPRAAGTPSPLGPARRRWSPGAVPGAVTDASPRLRGSGSRLGSHGALGRHGARDGPRL